MFMAASFILLNSNLPVALSASCLICDFYKVNLASFSFASASIYLNENSFS